ncbi:MAG: DUF2946 family protein [Hyphomicrobiaceae bacterium]|nr:DUF2946 family protein [Hyphomicrobiaceae bacterium]
MATWVVLVALCLRALVPAGYMPGTATAADGSKALTLVICTADGVRSVTIDVPDAPADGEHERQASDGLCPFALAGPALPEPPVAAVRGPFLVLMGQRVIPTPRLLLARVPTGPALGSRAPPLHS